MGKNYAVARVEQYTKDSIGKAERHIERKNKNYANMNVDLSRTGMNIHFKRAGDLTYNAHLDKLVEDNAVSLRGLKKDAKVFDEMIFDVNTAYFEERGGYEYAREFYEEVFHFAEKEYGPENIVSAVMHADELNTALCEQMSAVAEKYHALCRGFGKETVEAHVQEVLEREAIEKHQKKQARRRHDRDTR